MGKGGISDLAQKKGDILHINPRDLHVKADWNLRNMADPTNEVAIDRTAKMIVANGVTKMPPLLAYWEDGKAWIEDGHIRLSGALRAIEVYGHQVPTVPVVVSPFNGSEQDRVLSQITRNAGKPFSPIEQAAVFKRLTDIGMTREDLETRTGFSRVYVNDLLKLNELPAAAKKKIAAGEVSATLATQTLKASGGDGKKAAKALDEAVKTAKAKGKTKATAKDVVAAKKPNLKKELKTIFNTDPIKHTVADGIHTISFSGKSWARIEQLLGAPLTGHVATSGKNEDIV